MPTPNKNSSDRRLARNGGVLVIASAVLISLVARWEDGPTPRYKVYPDTLAGNLPTACNGLTKHTSPYPVIVGDVWSKERCDSALAYVLENTQYSILGCVKADLTQNQFDAMSDFAHNVGIGNACASRAFGLIDANRANEGCWALSQRPDGTPNWSYVGDKFYRGLYARRTEETTLCLKADPAKTEGETEVAAATADTPQAAPVPPPPLPPQAVSEAAQPDQPPVVVVVQQPATTGWAKLSAWVRNLWSKT